MLTVQAPETARVPLALTSRQSPAEQVRMLLARSRRHGVPFDAAWRQAIKRVRWPHDTDHRAQWKDVMEWSREVYRSAYDMTEGDPLQGQMLALQPAAA